jgi:hypothetical protein
MGWQLQRSCRAQTACACPALPKCNLSYAACVCMCACVRVCVFVGDARQMSGYVDVASGRYDHCSLANMCVRRANQYMFCSLPGGNNAAAMTRRVPRTGRQRAAHGLDFAAEHHKNEDANAE